jgi:hypothetical protein
MLKEKKAIFPMVCLKYRRLCSNGGVLTQYRFTFSLPSKLHLHPACGPDTPLASVLQVHSSPFQGSSFYISSPLPHSSSFPRTLSRRGHKHKPPLYPSVSIVVFFFEQGLLLTPHSYNALHHSPGTNAPISHVLLPKLSPSTS